MKNLSKINLWIKHFILTATCLTLIACGNEIDEQQKLLNARSYLERGDLASASLELRNILQANAENAEARFLFGSIKLQTGDLAGAENEFRRAAKAGWSNEETQIEIARVLMAQREYQKLLDEIKTGDTWSANGRANLLGLRALAEAGLENNSDAKTTLAEAEQYQNDAFQVLKTTAIFQLAGIIPGDAADTLKKALTIYSNDPEFLLLYADANLQQKNLAEAASTYQKIIEQEPAKSITANGRKARIGLAKLQIVDNKLDQAQETLAPLFRLNDNNPEVNYLGGLIAFETGDYKLAEERIRNLLELAPNHGPSLLLMGKIKYTLKEYSQAAQYYTSYLSGSPDDLAVRKQLALSYIALHQTELAKSTLQPALADNTDDIELQLLYGKLEINTGNTDAGIHLLRKIVDANPEDAALRKQLAVAYITAEKTEQALKEMQILQDQGNTTSEINVLKIYAYLKAKQYEKAIELANNMLKNNPDNASINSITGSVYAESGNLQQARKYFEKAIRLEENMLSASVGLAKIEHKEGNTKRAVELYEGLVRSGKGGTVPMIALAELAAEQDQNSEMINWLDKARKSAPDEVKPRILLANYYFYNKQIDKADLIIQEAIKIDPEDTEVLTLQSRILLGQQRYNEALTPLNKLVKKAPDSAYARALLGQTYARLGNLEDAREHLNHALDIDPDQMLALGLLAELELRQGNKDSSLSHAQHMQHVRPDLYQGYKLEGDVWMSERNYSKANIAYAKAWKKQKTAVLAMSMFNASIQSSDLDTALQPVLAWLNEHPNDTATRFFLATAYLDKNRNADAIREYEKVLESAPDNAEVLNNLAWLYSTSGNPKALDTAEKAYQSAPENPGIQDTYGWILIQQGQVAKGRRLLKQALDQLPETPEIQYHYAAALLQSGNKEEGLRMLDKLLSGGKSFEGREDAQRLRDEYAMAN